MKPTEPSIEAASGTEPVTQGGGLSVVLRRILPKGIAARLEELDSPGTIVSRLSLALALVLSLAAALFETGIGLERQLYQWRADLLQHPASGQIALVEIDARSLGAYDRWPWPRSLHGRAIAEMDRLGAKEVAFDVDFSAMSEETEDQAFAEAISSASIPVILPTFRQAESQGKDFFLENLPIETLRANALLASVNVMPDRDGFVRANPYGIVTDGTARPSLAVMLAGSNGSINTAFPIDLSIDPASIPRISFTDLIEGRIDRSAVEGKSLLIGATAVEMGDRYAVPGHGVLPGAVIQLMAAETLIRGSAPFDRGPILPLLIAFLAIAFFRRKSAAGTGRYVAIGLTLLCLPLASEALRLGTFTIMPALIALAIAAIGSMGEEVLNRLSESRLTDAATGLPNGRALVQRAASRGGRELQVMDIRNFNEVVSALGQRRAGVLMRRASERLSLVADGPVHCIGPATLGWLSSTADETEHDGQLDGAATLFKSPLEVEGRSILLLPAFGVAKPEANAAEALDQALVAAKTAGAGGQLWQRYDDEQSRQVDDRLSLAAEVDRAMAKGEIWVAYQPKLEIAAGQVTCVEALVRWTHPERGIVRPDELISIIEELDKVEELTCFVLREALKQQRAWLKQDLALGVAVNISARLPKHDSFIQKVTSILSVWGNPEAGLTFEVTESAAITHSAETIAGLERLAALGISISIDDYGTGQSTLSYLQRMPASEIKIDKSFVTDIAENESNRLMVKSTIKLAQDLGRRVVAEGIETEEVLAILAEAGCDFAQGYLIARPIPGAELPAVLREKALAVAVADRAA